MTTSPARDRMAAVFPARFFLTLPLLLDAADGPFVDDNPLLFAAQPDSTAKLKFLLMPDVGVYWRRLGKLTSRRRPRFSATRPGRTG
jgi:hypothetical protein